MNNTYVRDVRAKVLLDCYSLTIKNPNIDKLWELYRIRVSYHLLKCEIKENEN